METLFQFLTFGGLQFKIRHFLSFSIQKLTCYIFPPNVKKMYKEDLPLKCNVFLYQLLSDASTISVHIVARAEFFLKSVTHLLSETTELINMSQNERNFGFLKKTYVRFFFEIKPPIFLKSLNVKFVSIECLSVGFILWNVFSIITVTFAGYE